MKRFFTICTVSLLSLILILGCKDKKEPFSFGTHPEGWNDENSPNFHANLVLQGSEGLENCAECHGEDFSGGKAGVGCKSSGCHSIFPHPEGFADSLSAEFHGKKMGTEFKWNLTLCQECHGTDYKGEGYEEKNCTRCHQQPEGPEACNTCHGNENNAAPPKDLEGHWSTTELGVGAHQHHLIDTTLTNGFERDCIQCHIKPDDFEDGTHIDGSLPAEITFSSFATDSGKLNTIWDRSAATCSNVYCHGGFKFKKSESAFSWIYTDSIIVGNFPVVKWTEDELECGDCHDLPPKGHQAQTTCNTCHGKVVDENNEIINRKLHINGKIDVF